MCGTARSGIWVLSEHLRVEWRNRGTYEVRLSVLITRMGMEQQSEHKPMTLFGMELLVSGAESRSSCRLGVQEGMW